MKRSQAVEQVRRDLALRYRLIETVETVETVENTSQIWMSSSHGYINEHIQGI